MLQKLFFSSKLLFYILFDLCLVVVLLLFDKKTVILTSLFVVCALYGVTAQVKLAQEQKEVLFSETAALKENTQPERYVASLTEEELKNELSFWNAILVLQPTDKKAALNVQELSEKLELFF